MTAAEAAVVPYKNAAPEGADPSRSRSTAALRLTPREGPAAAPRFRTFKVCPKDLPAAPLQLHILHASTEHDFETVFATLSGVKAGALVISADPFFNSWSERLAELASRYAVPAIFSYREFAAAGGLMGGQ